MLVSVRSADPRFLEDIKLILGDRNGIVRRPPSRAEREEYRQLCGLLWGWVGSNDDSLPELDTQLAGHLRRPDGEPIEVRHADWGGQLVDLLPPRRVPCCRIWLLVEDGCEFLIALTDVTTVPEGRFPDLTAVVAPRARDLFPGSYIDQQV
jgi:hypothetical protein